MIAIGRVIPWPRGACKVGAMPDQLPEVSERIGRAVSAAADSLRLMASVFEHGGAGIIITDQDNRIVMVN